MNRYIVNSDGSIISKRLGRPLKPYKGTSGYLRFMLYTESGPTNKAVHRAVAERYIPNPEDKPEVNHIDGNKENNAVSNLEWVTHKENIKHAYTLGLKCNRGSAHEGAKLTASNVRFIRFESEGIKNKTLAVCFNVHEETISRIRRGISWSHINEV